MTLVLEEVQVPVVLRHGVVHRMESIMPRNAKVRAGGEVDQHRQPLGLGIEVDGLDGPRCADAQGSFEQFVMHGASLLVRSNATACRIRPHGSVRGVRAASRVRCAGLRPPLTPPRRQIHNPGTHSKFKRGAILIFTLPQTSSSGLSPGEYGGRRNSSMRSLWWDTNGRTSFALCVGCPSTIRKIFRSMPVINCLRNSRNTVAVTVPSTVMNRKCPRP